MEDLDMVKQSYGRACLHSDLIDRFYGIFLESDPAIKPMFQHTDFTKQKQLLKTGVIMMLSHLEGKSVWTEQLDRIVKSHSKSHLNVSPTLYPFWIDSLISAVKERDEQWTTDLEHKWRKALKAGVAYIAAGYEKM